MSAHIPFDPALAVNQIARQFPETVPVFKRFGFDTCCGGGVSIQEAAHRDGIDADLVFAELAAVFEREAELSRAGQ